MMVIKYTICIISFFIIVALIYFYSESNAQKYTLAHCQLDEYAKYANSQYKKNIYSKSEIIEGILNELKIKCGSFKPIKKGEIINPWVNEIEFTQTVENEFHISSSDKRVKHIRLNC